MRKRDEHKIPKIGSSNKIEKIKKIKRVNRVQKAKHDYKGIKT